MTEVALVEAVVPVSYADAEIRKRLNALRKIKSPILTKRYDCA
jgi:hypothetical protein